MRISATIFAILISTYVVNASGLDPVIENVVHLKAFKPPSGVSGMWKKKTIWKPRWVKEWKSAKVTKPVWRKVWGPVQIREWLPIPKPPPGWDSLSTPLAAVRPKPQKLSPSKDSLAHHSLAEHTVAPLWDPVPYPESQQPPPPQQFSPSSYSAEDSCGSGGCDNSPSHTFNHQQIIEIVGPRYQPPGHFQNPEYSETVNHLTRLPPEGSNWRPPPSVINFPFDNHFSNLPEFLVPPKPLLANNFNLHLTNNKPIAVPFPPFEVQNVPPWIPLPPENKFKGHVVTKPPDHRHKLQMLEVDAKSQNSTSTPQKGLQKPEKDSKEKPNSQSGTVRPPQAVGDFIQEAQLVGEYHYSEFDLPDIKTQQNQKTTGELPKHKPKEGKQKQTQKPEVHNGNSHVQKKHIPPPNPNLQQQETSTKEIFPNYQTPKNTNLTLIQPKENKNHEKSSSTKLTLISPTTITTHHNIQQTKEIYPIYKTPQTANPSIHRFILPPDIKLEEQLTWSNNTTTKTEAAQIKFTKPKTPLSDKTNTIQLVFATTPVDYNKSLEDLQKTTTTEPYEVIFSSSSLSTPEAVTKSPVIIVTPANSKS